MFHVNTVLKTLKISSASSVLAAAVAFTPVAPVKTAQASDLGKVVVGGAILCAVTRCLDNRGGNSGNKGSAAQAAPRYSEEQLAYNRQTQSALNTFGFNAGPVDGRPGRMTRAAISRYQGHMGWPQSGQLDQYQRDHLVGATAGYNRGEAAQYPNLMQREGIGGYLRGYNNPQYLARYGDNPYGGNHAGLQPQQPVLPGTDAVQPQTGGRAIADNSKPQAITPLTPLQPITTAAVSVQERCDLVELTTRSNGQQVIEANMHDPDQALSEQFCDAREFAIVSGQTILDNSRTTEQAAMQSCATVQQRMDPVTDMLGASSVAEVTAAAATANSELGLGDPNAAAGYGQLCLGIGYRTDNAEMALASSLVMVGSGAKPFSELVAHHMREGFGVTKNADASVAWYEDALSALQQNATPAFLPSKSAQRAAVIRAAIQSASFRAQVTPFGGSNVRIVPVSNIIVVDD